MFSWCTSLFHQGLRIVWNMYMLLMHSNGRLGRQWHACEARPPNLTRGKEHWASKPSRLWQAWQALHCTHSKLPTSHPLTVTTAMPWAWLIIPASYFSLIPSMPRLFGKASTRMASGNSASHTEPCGVLVRHAKGGFFHIAGVPELTLEAVFPGGVMRALFSQRCACSHS